MPRKTRPRVLHLQADRVRNLIALHPDWSQSQIAEEMGITRAHVSKLIRVFQIPYTIKDSHSSKSVRSKHRIHLLPGENQRNIAYLNASAKAQGMTYGQLVASDYDAGKGKE